MVVLFCFFYLFFKIYKMINACGDKMIKKILDRPSFPRRRESHKYNGFVQMLKFLQKKITKKYIFFS